ncbi:MAG: SPASM domain-containing protein [Nitrospirae bacterium]|nr:SPASM domain-containing protein [Magnetococcales bacterium]
MERFLTYAELKTVIPIKTDNYLRLDISHENVAKFFDYIRGGMSLIPIVRSNPNFPHRSDLPTRVLLEMTSRCNLKCTMCPRQSLERMSIDMEPELFKKCVDALDDIHIDGLWIFNLGESILHSEFPRLLDYVSSKKNLGPVWLSSNGRALDARFSEMIIQSNVTFMNLSVNADRPETYEKISPSSDWNQHVVNFRGFIDQKRASGRRTPFTRVQIIDQSCAREEVDPFLRRYAGYADILAINLLEAFSQNVESNRADAILRQRLERKSCHRINRSDLFIFSNGETTFCDTDFNAKFTLGNIKNKTIREIWNSDLRKELIALNKTGGLNQVELCRDCLDYDL